MLSNAVDTNLERKDIRNSQAICAMQGFNLSADCQRLELQHKHYCGQSIFKPKMKLWLTDIDFQGYILGQYEATLGIFDKVSYLHGHTLSKAGLIAVLKEGFRGRPGPQFLMDRVLK